MRKFPHRRLGNLTGPAVESRAADSRGGKHVSTCLAEGETMDTKKWFGDREQALENEYFRRKDRELIDKLREDGVREQDHRLLKERLGNASEALVTKLEDAGFTPDTLAVLHIVPLVQVAWADDWVDSGERELIFALAAARGVAPDTPAHAQLSQWLETQPDAQFFEMVDALLASTLDLLPTESRDSATDELLDWTTRIAEATGGTLGMMPISKAERACIARIAERLAPGESKPTP